MNIQTPAVPLDSGCLWKLLMIEAMFYRIFLLFLCAPLFLQGQSSLVISGTVVNHKAEPLAFANIGIINSALGTISNSSGEFEFIVPTELSNDTVVISYVGYKSFKTLASGVKNMTITMEEAPVVLQEVVVESDHAKLLVQKASRSIKIVYPGTPVLMDAFHRSWEKIEFADGSDCPGTLIEAAIKIYDPGYSSKDREEVFLQEIRKSILQDGWVYGKGSIVKDLLDRNLVKYPNASSFVFIKSVFTFSPELVFAFEGTTTMDDEQLDVIRVTVPNDRNVAVHYRLFISEKDYAILRYELHAHKNEIEFSTGPWHTGSLEVLYIFKRYQGKPFLHYVNKQYTIKLLDLAAQKVVRTETYFRELLVNNIVTSEVHEKRKQLTGSKSKDISLALQGKGYNEQFWKNYNVVKENPLDKTLVQYFEQNQKKEPCGKSGMP
jgi:hypothetical protein